MNKISMLVATALFISTAGIMLAADTNGISSNSVSPMSV